jgi:hypothetical protein
MRRQPSLPIVHCVRASRSVCCRFFLTQVFVEQECPERKNGGDKGLRDKSGVPLVFGTEPGQLADIEQKQNTMDRPCDPDGHRHPHEVLHRHGDEQQDEKGSSLS